MAKSSIKKNMAYQAMYEILILILPFFTSPYISRLLGPEKLGIYAYTYSIAYYFLMFGMLGIKFYGNRAIASVRDDQYKTNQIFTEILIIHIVFSVISIVCYFAYVMLFSDYRLYAAIQGIVVLSGLFDISWLFFGLEKFKESVLRNAIVKILTVICIFTFVRNVDDLWIYVLIMSASILLSQLILCVQANKYVKIELSSIQDLRIHIKPLFVLFVPVLALSLFKYMDKIMLGAIGNKIELGYYENAEKVINIPLSVIFSAGSVMLPKMSNLVANNNKDSVSYYMKMTIKYLTGVSFAMVGGLIGVSSVFAISFWGNDFFKSGTLIALLSISLPFSTLASIIRNQDMIPKGKDIYYSYSIIAGAVINLIVNALLIPSFQSFGVAIGTIVAEITVCLFELWFVRNEKNYLGSILTSLRFVIPSAFMCILVYIIGNLFGARIITLLLQIVVGVVSFVLFAGLTLAVTHDEDIPIFVGLINQVRHKIKSMVSDTIRFL